MTYRSIRKLTIANLIAAAFATSAVMAVNAQTTNDSNRMQGQSNATNSASERGSQGMTGQAGSSSSGTVAPSASTQPSTSNMLKAEEVKKVLEDRGYSDIGDLKREGQALKTQAKRDDESVDLRIIPLAGMMQKSDEPSESRVTDVLKKQGYSSIEDMEREGKRFMASAKHDGDDVRLRVDTDKGHVIEEKERSS